ncbi:MAG: Na+/H+ antiporter NhaA [Atopobiaceae bacterium]|nr:Na+/H+ antiporter NhaA [Atopobiaceae bacterium]
MPRPDTTESAPPGGAGEQGTEASRRIIEVPFVLRHVHRRRAVERVASNGTISAGIMVLAAVAAVAVANSPAYEAFHGFLEMPLGLAAGPLGASMTLEGFVNDALMAVFFLLVGIELKYEVTVGELRQPRQAALPMFAAAGGALIPCIIYLAVNQGGAVHGWAVPMATDIAFALGVMSLLGDRVAPATKVFFSTLAIADDLFAIVVIAVAYGQSPNPLWLLASAGATCILVAMNRRGVYYSAPYLAVGLVLWFCLLRSGVHATLAGVILAFCLPARSDVRLGEVGEWLASQGAHLDRTYDKDSLVLGQHDYMRAARRVERVMHHVSPPLQRVENSIAIPVNFVILPLFAFVNAQVRLAGVDLGALLGDPVTRGVFLGAVVGKPLGIVAVTWLLVRVGFARLPSKVDWAQVVGVGLMGGLGFTMSILIAGLAFADPAEVLAAKFAILCASVAAGVLGCVFLLVADLVRPQGGRRGSRCPDSRS